MNESQAPLRGRIVNGKLIIEIGLETLKFSAEQHLEFWGGKRGPDEPSIIVDDISKFAGEVLLEFQREEEDGTTLLTLMLDRAIAAAIENGCEGARLPE